MNFPVISQEELLKKLTLPPKSEKIRMVLDTDTYNEVDDQFAIVYALQSPERLNVEAIYAAPFHNNRSTGPEDGMEKSYDEILRILERLDVSPDDYVYKGSRGFLDSLENPFRSEAALDLVERAMNSSKDPLYVVAIGAITNVASAILIEPKIIERIVVVWLGGHALHWGDTNEFNMKQDILASRLVLDCGVPLVQVPCMGVTSHLHTTLSEIKDFVIGKGAIGDFLAQRFEEYHHDHFAYSKVIWDISTIAYLLHGEESVSTQLVHSPILTDQVTYSFDASRHFIRYAHYISRDNIFKDLFTKLADQAKAGV